jgi:uncharacterized protein (DUF2252 family)
MTETSADLIAAYNASRDPSRLALKYRAMRASPFTFLRGTAHLFHRRIAALDRRPAGPPAWISGDLHLENFGTYLGGNGLTYFDVNDFDECAIAPCTWDVLRLSTSLLVAAPSYKFESKEALDLAAMAFETYRREVAAAKPRWLERRTASGVIGDLMDDLKHRDAKKFVLKRTIGKRGEKLDVDAPKMQAIADASELRAVQAFVETQAQVPGGTPLYRFRDAAYRIAGTGSLGIRRYVVLAEHVQDGSLLLLDLKEALPSTAAPLSGFPQPAFDGDAQRIVAAQTHAQAMPPALLQAVSIQGRPFVLRELQPTSDRLNLADVSEQRKDFADTVGTMAALSAWAQLRTSGHMTAAAADQLSAFAQDPKALGDGLFAAQAMERLTISDWQDYCRAYDAGRFDAVLKQAAPGKGDDPD